MNFIMRRRGYTLARKISEEKSSNKKYGSYTDEELNDWAQLPANIQVLTSSGFGAWLMRRDERKGNRDLINELEKIKAEIINCFSQENDIDSDPYNHALDIAISIIHDHISELKGDNK